MKTRDYTRYINSLRLKDGRVPPKGHVAIILTFPRNPNLVPMVEAGLSAQLATCEEWLVGLNAVTGMYGRGFWLAIVPAKTAAYKNILETKAIYTHSAIFKSRNLVLGELPKTIEIPTVKTLYLPTMEELRDVVSYGHNLITQRAITEVAYNIRRDDPNVTTMAETPSMTELREYLSTKNLGINGGNLLNTPVGAYYVLNLNKPAKRSKQMQAPPRFERFAHMGEISSEDCCNTVVGTLLNVDLPDTVRIRRAARTSTPSKSENAAQLIAQTESPGKLVTTPPTAEEGNARIIQINANLENIAKDPKKLDLASKLITTLAAS